MTDGEYTVERIVERYPEGERVDARVNPDRPEEAFLTLRNTSSLPTLMVGFGVTFVLVGVGVFVLPSLA